MKTITNQKFWVLLCVLFFAIGSWAQIITVTGNWIQIIDSSNLQGPAGSDLNPSYESAIDEIYIDLEELPSDWEVDVKKFDENWDPNLNLYIQKISDGTAGTPLEGGEGYQLVTDSDQFFFEPGSGGSDLAINGIYIQLKVDGVSVQIPPDIYITKVYYTIIANN
ncbi:hypothetical protein ACFLRM_05795 [Acidobacteriota bacterium]